MLITFFRPEVWRLFSGKQLKKAQQRQKDCFDKGVETCQYAPGDLVFLFNPQVKTGEAAKFHGERKGHYEVLERTIEVNYRIKTPSDPGSRSKVIHFNNLKLYQCKRGEFTRGQEKGSKAWITVAIDTRTYGTKVTTYQQIFSPSHEIPWWCL